MREEILMPHMGYDMESGVVDSWLVGVGDAIERGQAIVEIATDKATVAVEALASGRLAEIVATEGDEVAVGKIIAYLDVEE